MLAKVKKVTKQIGELTVQRHGAGSLDPGGCLGAARSNRPKSELDTLYRYENISVWSNVLCSFRICTMSNTDLQFIF